MTDKDALEIWHSGVCAVDPFRLINRFFALEKEGNDWLLRFGDVLERLRPGARLIVVGMGKASGRMAAAVEKIAQPLIAEHRLSGWVNVPDNCVELLQAIRLHGARPATRNEPTCAGVRGSERILETLKSSSENDLILCLVSGGGSALLPMPVPPISLREKLDVTRFLSAQGANIEELNTVRKELSLLKGGGLKRICRHRRLVSLVLSDVLGDPLDVIASGATVENRSTPLDAWQVAQKYRLAESPDLSAVADYLRDKAETWRKSETIDSATDSTGYDGHRVFIVGNNQTAVEAAAVKARELGYSPQTRSADRSEGEAEQIGRELYRRACDLFYGARRSEGCDCLIEGGEPVVRLVPEQNRGLGGRNQQLVLAALVLARQERKNSGGSEKVPVILSGGTDGEDGPTDAAGAWLNDDLLTRLEQRIRNGEPLDPETFLQRNDAWHFFELLDALIQTGPTGTNVCDLRIALKR